MDRDPSTIPLCECEHRQRIASLWTGCNRDGDRLGWYSYCDDCHRPLSRKDAVLHAMARHGNEVTSEARIAGYLLQHGIHSRREATVTLRYPQGVPLGVPARAFTNFAHGEAAVCDTDAGDVPERARDWLERPDGAALGERVSSMIRLAARGPLLEWANAVVALMRLSVAPSEAEKGQRAIESACDAMRGAVYA